MEQQQNDAVLVPETTSPSTGIMSLARKFVVVPEHPRARLMFYLHCINNVLDLSPLEAQDISKLIDYNNYFKLSDSEHEGLLVLCILFYPGSLTGKCIFMDEDACDQVENDFFEKSTSSRQKYAFLDSVTLGKNSFAVNYIMLYRLSFLEKNFFEPLQYYDHVLDKLRLAGKRLSPGHVTSTSGCCSIL